MPGACLWVEQRFQRCILIPTKNSVIPSEANDPQRESFAQSRDLLFARSAPLPNRSLSHSSCNF